MTGSTTGTTINPLIVTLLGSLHLVNAAGTGVTPFANYAAFNSWILGASSQNAAYMLSAQLATMELNVYFGLANANEMVQVTDPTLIFNLGLVPNGGGDYYVKLSVLLTAAIAELTAAPYTVGASAHRTYEVAIQTLLNSLNNNQAPIILSAGACPFVTPY